MSRKEYKTEWSFSFEKIGEQISDTFENIFGEGEDGENGGVKEAHFETEKAGVQGANVNVHFSVGRNSITALENSDNLMEADIKYIGDVEFLVSGEAEKTVTLKQTSGMDGMRNFFRRGFGSLRFGKELSWDIGLSPDVPTNLTFHSGLSQSNLDLSKLNLTEFNFNGGAGETKVILPQSDTPYNATFREGVGETDITLPANTTMNVDIKAGVGEIKIHVTGPTAVRLNAQSGIGEVIVPRHYQRVEGKSNDLIGRRGMWQSPDFEKAEHQITINFNGGVGSFKIVSDVVMV